MDKIFGIPIEAFMAAFLVLFAIGVIAMAVVGLRNRVIFRMAVRNLPRRPTQTMLIVVGLMLATLLFSASFSTGDTMTHSLRLAALREIGPIDEVVQGKSRDASGRLPYFDESLATTINQSVLPRAADAVAGVVPVIRETAPVFSARSGLSEPAVDVLGLAPDHAKVFGALKDAKGAALDLGSLAAGEVYLSQDAATKLEVGAGDELQVFLAAQPTTLKVAGIYTQGAHPAGDTSLSLSLARLQELTGSLGKVNSVLIDNTGNDITGGEQTDAVVAAVEPLLAGTTLEVTPVKQDALKEADSLGTTFSAIFLLFAQFSIAAGILLIFLIFVMLAAERKHELGMARALGAQRGHVIRLFALEGALYALIAAAVGSLLGVAVGWGMVRIMAVAFGASDLQMSFFFNWKSVVIAYTMGVVFTFVVVVLSSWRASRLNIVRAVRGLPEPRTPRRGRRQTVLMVLVLVVGVLLSFAGFQAAQVGPTFLGISLIIIGLGLLARRLGAPDRAAFTGAGVALLVLWLLPSGTIDRLFPDMSAGIEMFFISGIMLVIAAVWVVIYNSDLLVRATVAVLGRFRSLPPILKTAVAYPMQNRFRTGMTLAMFSLVVFTLVCMAFIIAGIGGIYGDTQKLSGGFDVRASASYTNPIPDLEAALNRAAQAAPTDPNVAILKDVTEVGTLSGAFASVRQAGTSSEPGRTLIYGIDKGYADGTTYDFIVKAPGYDSAQAVWQALLTEPNTAVVNPVVVPSRVNYAIQTGEVPFMMEGFYQQDQSLPVPAVSVEVADPSTGQTRDLRVIGVLSQAAAYSGFVMTSTATLQDFFAPQPVPPVMYLLKVDRAGDAEAVGKALKKTFLVNGMQAEDIAGEIRRNARATVMVNTLLQGFMALGLVVGIASLGVIAARSVVERRQQIGVLRAIGFQKSMVQTAFLLESSFVALLGIGMGVVLGGALAPSIIKGMQEQFQGMPFAVPWQQLLVVIVVAYVASLLTTYIPARQAARVYPAEALRYE